MKRSIALPLHIVLICGILCFLTVVHSEEEITVPVNNTCASVLQYFKTKGILDADVQINLDSPRCHSSETIPEIFTHMQEDLKEFMERRMPEEANCVTDDISERQRTLDLILAATTIQADDSLTEKEKQVFLTGPRNELKQDLQETAAKCGISEDNLILLLRKCFEDAETITSNR